MDENYVRLLAVLETKIETLIDTGKGVNIQYKVLEARMDELEKLRHWIMGTIGALALGAGLLFYVGEYYIAESVRKTLKDVGLKEEVCREYRIKRDPKPEDMPQLCK